MFDDELKMEILRLEKQIDVYKNKICKAKSDQKEIEASISNLQKSKNEVEEGLIETFENIKRRFERLNVKESFKENHYSRVKSIIFGSTSSSAINSIQESLHKAKIQYLELDDDIDVYYKTIAQFENRLYDLKSQLKQVGV
jgi:chromosome segregation ATPase